jgi:hypothetical protein
MGEARNACRISIGKQKGRHYLSVYGTIILKRILKK